MKHLGDYDTSAVIYGKFTTFRPSTGAAYTLGGTPALSVYKDNSTTQSTTGVTLTADFDSVTGLNHFAIDTSADGTFYAAGSFFDVVITTGTVDSVSVVGSVVASFTLRKNSALKPTTAGRTLDVTATGEAGIDWANIGSPTTTVNLSGTTVKTATDVETDTADIQTRLPAALTAGGNIKADVIAVSGDTTAADNLELQFDGTGLTGDTYPSTQAQVGNLAVGSSAISTTASSFTKTTGGAETNTYTATVAQNGTYHIVPPSGGNTDIYYQFDVGPNGVPVSVDWVGYAQSNTDTYQVYFYNWAGTSWEQVGSIAGASGTTPVLDTFSATTAHVGTGANEGLVRWRVTSSDGNAFATDRLLCNYAVVNTALGYDLGRVWVDEDNGTSSGTTPGVDALVTNRSDDFDNAQAVADALGYHDINVTNGNAITLTAALEGYDVYGNQCTMALGGQNVGDTEFYHFLEISGTGTTTGGVVRFTDCAFGTCTLPPLAAHFCGFDATITLSTAGSYEFVDCYSEVAGTGTPVIDMGAAVGATNVFFRRYSGGLTINNIAAGDVISVDVVSGGTITLNGADGNVQVRGMCNVVDNRTGTPTLGTTNNMDARFDTVETTLSTLATAANLATVDTVVDAIKAKTDSLAFTVAGQVDSNVQYVNDVVVTGDGSPGNEWGP